MYLVCTYCDRAYLLAYICGNISLSHQLPIVNFFRKKRSESRLGDETRGLYISVQIVHVSRYRLNTIRLDVDLALQLLFKTVSPVLVF